MKALFNKKEKEFLIKNMKGLWARDLVVLFNKEFNRNITTKQLQMWRENHRLKSNVYNRYSKEEIEFLKDACSKYLTADIVSMYKEKFDKDITINQLYAIKHRYHINSGIDCKYKKGQKSFNEKAIGTETVVYEKDKKQIFVKVDNNNWKRKQVYEWEKHYGKLPENSIIFFLDGNRDNFDIDNLQMLTRRESNVMAGMDLFTNNKEINKTAIEIAKMVIKTREMMTTDEKYR